MTLRVRLGPLAGANIAVIITCVCGTTDPSLTMRPACSFYPASTPVLPESSRPNPINSHTPPYPFMHRPMPHILPCRRRTRAEIYVPVKSRLRTIYGCTAPPVHQRSPHRSEGVACFSIRHTLPSRATHGAASPNPISRRRVDGRGPGKTMRALYESLETAFDRAVQTGLPVRTQSPNPQPTGVGGAPVRLERLAPVGRLLRTILTRIRQVSREHERDRRPASAAISQGC